MRSARRTGWTTAAVVVAGLMLACCWGFGAKYETIQAFVMGEGTQLGRHCNVTIHIYEYSTAEDQKILLDAFKEAGQKGLMTALGKMKAKGHIAIDGTLGTDINYIREFKVPEGRKIRIVTDRPIRFGEVWSGARSMDYNVSAAEIIISPEKGKSTGTVLPAMQLKIDDKTNEIGIEAFQNPWKLLNIRVTLPKK